jgi:hypothetical protein
MQKKNPRQLWGSVLILVGLFVSRISCLSTGLPSSVLNISAIRAFFDFSAFQFDHYLPPSGRLITSAMGAVFNPLWVAITAGVGRSRGRTFWLPGGDRRSQFVVEDKDWYERS